ncbi:helix-turn-helix transcriptional regulator [Cyanobacterium aponinum]|uniref:helix-turn-helix transcriptional regulator n=1 Tax=Cyanobacterium aponinum TaxID=379064 RepID=UPI003CCA4E45
MSVKTKLLKSAIFVHRERIKFVVIFIVSLFSLKVSCILISFLFSLKYRDQVRFQLAVEWLKDTNIPIGEIAFELHYSEINSFTRSFKRWTGVTPSDYRYRLHSTR